jgi:glucose/arabinose dehydrogenase
MSLRPYAILPALALVGAVAFGTAASRHARAVPCDSDNASLTLPAGFCATVFGSNLGAPRHMVVAPNGDLLVIANASNVGAESGGGSPGGGLYLLRDANGDGKVDFKKRIGNGNGSGIQLANGYLYASLGRAILRYKYATGDTLLGVGDTIVTDLLPRGHTAYNFIVDGNTLYLNVGSQTNSCQEKDRQKDSKGIDPCVELDTRAGVWAFAANKLNQKQTEGTRYATGMRNSVSLTINPRDHSLWATMHGRDNLADNWGMTPEYSAENPAEQVNHILKGDNFGWPYCYFSNEEHHLVTAPEYGGDQKKTDRCTTAKKPEYAFPGHWAPNDMMFYTGKQFPATYTDGAFIAFHGSWNRAPLPQQGFRVVFLPMKGGKAGPHQDFALDFSNNGGPGKDGKLHRPTGLAQGTDGSLFIADDVGGTIYKVSYKGK